MTRFGDSAGGASVLDISRLSSVSTEIASLGAQVAAITSLGTITGEITALGTSANVATLAALTTTDSNGDTVALPGLSDVASITTEIGALGTTANVANINSIATSVVSGTSQLTLDAVGNALTNVNLVGSSIGNVNAVATSGAILFSALSETPAAPSPANANLDKGLKYDGSGNLVLADIVEAAAFTTALGNKQDTLTNPLTASSAIADWNNLTTALGNKQDNLGSAVSVVVDDLGISGIVNGSVQSGQSGSQTWSTNEKQTAIYTASGTTQITLSEHTGLSAGTGLTLIIIDAQGASLNSTPIDVGSGQSIKYMGGTPPTISGASGTGQVLVVSLLSLGSGNMLASYVTVE